MECQTADVKNAEIESFTSICTKVGTFSVTLCVKVSVLSSFELLGGGFAEKLITHDRQRIPRKDLSKYIAPHCVSDVFTDRISQLSEKEASNKSFVGLTTVRLLLDSTVVRNGHSR